MSRRKQENPQPRKNLVTAETDLLQDTLICGVCQKDFSLSDIVKFIQHKVHSCNKENCLLYGDGDVDSDLDGDGNKHVVSARRPSISAPISRKDGAVLSRKDIKRNSALQRPGSALGIESNSVDEEVGRCHSRRDLTPPNSEDNGEKEEVQDVQCVAKEVADADTNTNNSEPNSYVCSTCKQTFTSAWVLVQHAQNVHGLKIYVDTSNNSSNNNPSPPAPADSQEQQAAAGQTSSLAVGIPALQALRVPLLERQFGPSLNSHSLFSRPSSQEFRVELGSDQLPRLGLNASSEGSQQPFERTSLETRSRGPSLSLGFEPQMDFYSQRLRQLAGATSPNSATTPRKLLTPSFAALLNLPTPTPPPPVPPSTTPQPPQQQQQSSSSSPSEQPTSPKLKSCEFCGKSFRFQSNLIVHRRSHTGEKPYKCHICNHACSQASKLKRHMKTHRNKSPGGSTVSENTSVESARSTPDSTEGGGGKQAKRENGAEDNNSDAQAGDEDEEEEDEEEDEDEEEEEEEEEEMEEEDGEEEEEAEEEDGDAEKSNRNMVAEDLTTRGPNSSTPVPGSGTDEPEKTENATEKPSARHSLLSEVMEKIGLAHIQHYNEAFKQALKESSAAKTSVKHERISSGTDVSNEANANSEDGQEKQPARSKSARQSPVNFGLLGAFDQTLNSNKRVKLESGDQWREPENLYAGLWLPSLSSPYRELYLGMSAGESDASHRKSSTESALNSVTPARLLQAISPRPGTSGSGGNGSLVKSKEQRRNDTCEYCGKVFKNCSNLTVHRRSHTGEKPYKCGLCTYACAQSSKLTRHMKTHGRLGKDVYRCRFCEMPFSVPSTLEKHMRKCVVNQNPSLVLSERDSDSKDTA